jgi:multidrug resistance protein
VLQPLIWASFSDYGGRKPIYLVSLAGFIAANALLAALPANIAALFILRILQAIGASGVTSIGAGTVADITEPRSRASALSIFLLGPQVGPIIGPLIGGQLAESSTWRWIFGFLGKYSAERPMKPISCSVSSLMSSLAISCSMVYILIVLHLPETLRYLVGNGSVFAQTGWVVPLRFRQRQVVDEGRYPRAPRPSPKLYLKVLSYPPIFVVCVTGALLFAAFYAVLVTFPDVLKEVYGFSNAEVGYAYLAPGRCWSISVFVYHSITATDVEPARNRTCCWVSDWRKGV